MTIPSSTWASWCRRSKYVSVSLAVLGERVIFGTCLRFFQNLPYYHILWQIIFIVWSHWKHKQLKCSIKWVTTKIMNVNDVIVYFYWLGWLKNRENIFASLHFKYLSILILFYYWTLQSFCCCAYVCPL